VFLGPRMIRVHSSCSHKRSCRGKVQTCLRLSRRFRKPGRKGRSRACGGAIASAASRRRARTRRMGSFLRRATRSRCVRPWGASGHGPAGPPDRNGLRIARADDAHISRCRSAAPGFPPDEARSTRAGKTPA
jgi:hypothetical protein